MLYDWHGIGTLCETEAQLLRNAQVPSSRRQGVQVCLMFRRLEVLWPSRCLVWIFKFVHHSGFSMNSLYRS